MKRLFSLLLCLGLLLALLPSGFAEGDVVEICDAEGLLAIAERPDGRYALAADIDLSQAPWRPIPFCGELDGRGHTIYNLEVLAPGDEVRTTRDGNLKEYETVFAGFFSTLENARVRDLRFRAAHIALESDRHCFIGVLAGYSDGSSVENCAVEGRLSLVTEAVMVGMGGVIGYGFGSVRDCEAELELFFEDRLFDRRCEQFMGGVLGCGMAEIEGCSVSIQGYDSCHGYVHDGGLVGMNYACGTDYPRVSVSGNAVTGQISFFEDNPDRRAYCAPYIGEVLTGLTFYYRNDGDFERRETFDYSRVLLPHDCEGGDWEETVTPSSCDSWGCTRHSCRVCGYAWVDRYTPPQHTGGDWERVRESGYGTEGLEQRRCTVCGELLEERSLPALVATQSCALSESEAELHPGDTLRLTAAVLPADATDTTLVWTSSDERVARVDENGLLRAIAPGTAVITARSADGFCSDACQVRVSYTFIQWLRSLFS